MKRIAVIVVFFAGFMLITWLPSAHADATTTKTSSSSIEAVDADACGISLGDLAAIRTIQNDNSLSYLDEVKQELAVRKDLLIKTILCAKINAEEQKVYLTNAAIDPDFKDLENQWSGKLDDAMSYYDIQLQRVNGAGISGTESIARDVLSWRKNNYAPLAENVSNFIMWSKNQNLFVAAQSRLAEIKSLVDSPLFSESLDVQSTYEEAAVSLTTSLNQNTSAKTALAQSLSPDESLSLIKQSLDSLSSTYEHFFDISNLIQSLLPQ